ncbi:hypothetical protein MD484_g6468, partial [Candolleomyces efflorescens]
MAHILVTSGPGFDLGDALREALAFDPEEPAEEGPRALNPSLGPSEPASASACREFEGKVQSAKNARRRLTRERRKAEDGRKVRPKAALKHLPKTPVLESVAKITQLPVTSCGYHGTSEGKSRASTNPSVEELRQEGYVEIEWDGVTPQVVVDDASKKALVIMSGQPLDPTYQECQERVTEKILRAREAADFQPEELDHHRASNSAALNHGVFHGQGTPRPLNLCNGARTELVEGLCRDPDVCRMAHFADTSFKTWSPGVYDDIEGKLNQIYSRDASLSKPFPFSVYPCAAFNFGPQVCCKGHRDSSNYPSSMCAIQALGRFNPKRGGHLYIKELKIFIQFPASSTILLPSALLTHGNTPVQDGEVRLSFTQFCPGGLIRWVDNDFQTQKRLQKRLSKAEFAERMKMKETHWEEGLARMPTLGQLQEKYARLEAEEKSAELEAKGKSAGSGS